METPPREIVGNAHVLPAGRIAKAISRHLTGSYLAKSFKDAWMYADHFAPQLKHCWLRNVNKHTLKAGQGTPGMGHWLYTLPTAPFTKVANGPSKWGLQHRSGSAAPGAGHFWKGPNSHARHRWTILAVMSPGAQGVPGKSDTKESGISLWNTLKPLVQLPHLNRQCRYLETANRGSCVRELPIFVVMLHRS